MRASQTVSHRDQEDIALSVSCLMTLTHRPVQRWDPTEPVFNLMLFDMDEGPHLLMYWIGWGFKFRRDWYYTD
jgi:hypothetical protein